MLLQLSIFWGIKDMVGIAKGTIYISIHLFYFAQTGCLLSDSVKIVLFTVVTVKMKKRTENY